MLATGDPSDSATVIWSPCCLDVFRDALNKLFVVLGSPLLCNIHHQYILHWSTNYGLNVGIVLGLGDPEPFACNVAKVLLHHAHAQIHTQRIQW